MAGAAAVEEPIFFQGMPKESAAFRLMKQMGWEEGYGLGKEKQGIRQHVRVSKKSDNSGIGANAASSQNWAFNTTAFDKLLKDLKVQVGETTVTKKLEQQDSEDSDEEIEREKKVRRVVRPLGRYKKQERGKSVQNYSKTDLECILGGTVKKSDEEEIVAVYTKQKTTAVVSCPSLSRDDEDEATESLKPNHPSLVTDWWGSEHGFVRGGMLGSAKQEPTATATAVVTAAAAADTSKSKSSFCEDDQEKLYKLVQDKATTGKQGLGIGDRPKKIGGAHWKGAKVTFDSEAEDEEEEEGKEEEEEGKERKDEDRQRSKKRKIEGPSNKKKWKKVCRELLLQEPEERMKLKKVVKHLSGLFNDVDGLKKKVEKSCEFVIKGKQLCLVASK